MSQTHDYNRPPTGAGADREGLHGKYRVERTDGRDAVFGPHYGCSLFVLDLTHDPHARAAALAYARSCEEARPNLAVELRSEVYACQSEPDPNRGDE